MSSTDECQADELCYLHHSRLLFVGEQVIFMEGISHAAFLSHSSTFSLQCFFNVQPELWTIVLFVYLLIFHVNLLCSIVYALDFMLCSLFEFLEVGETQIIDCKLSDQVENE